MLSGIAALSLVVIWALAPPFIAYQRLKGEGAWSKVFGIIGVLATELVLLMCLALMHAISYNGILNWAFWFN